MSLTSLNSDVNLQKIQKHVKMYHEDTAIKVYSVENFTGKNGLSLSMDALLEKRMGGNIPNLKRD